MESRISIEDYPGSHTDFASLELERINSILENLGANVLVADTGLLNAEFKLAELVVGLAILDACVPECGYGLDSASGEPIFPDSEAATVVAHLRGSASGFAYNAYLAQSSGTFSVFETDGSGSGAGLGLALDSGGFRLALDYAQITVVCNPVDDNERARWGVAVSLGGFGAHYFFAEDETGTETEETTNIDVVYLIETGDATVGPEYRTTTVKAPAGTETTENFLLFGMSMEF